MTKKYLPTLAYCFLFLTFFLISQADSKAFSTDEQGCFSTLWPHERSDLEPDPAIVFGRLENGFRYVLLENQTPKDRVAMFLNVQAGSLHETDSERGVAHFLEHMLFNGSTHFKPGELISYFQSLGMNFGGDTNAYTSFNETVYNIFLPTGELKEIEKGFLVMSDFSRGALLLEEEVERERGVILAEKVARDSAAYRTRLAAREDGMRGTLFSERDPIGVLEILQSANSDTLRSFYNKWYRPENMILVVVGDYKKEEVEPLLKTAFGQLQGEGELPSCPDYGELGKRDVTAFHYFEPEVGSVRIALESQWNKEPEDDSFVLQREKLRQYAGMNILQKRLDAQLEDGLAVFSNPQVYTGTLSDVIGYSGLSVETDAAQWRASLIELKKNLLQILIHGVTEEEVTLEKRGLSTYYETAVATAPSRQSTDLARQIIRHLNGNRVFQSPDQEKKLYVQEVNALNKENINSSLQTLWSYPGRRIEVTGKLNLPSDRAEEIIISAYNQVKGADIAKPEGHKKIDFPYIKVAKDYVSSPTAEYIEEIDTEIHRYENGTILLLKKTDFSQGEFEIAVNFGPGQRNEPQPGLSMLAESVINSSGTARLTATELRRVLTGTTVEYDFKIHPNTFTLKGKASTGDSEKVVQTLLSLLLDPGVRREAFGITMKDYEQMYKRLENEINGAQRMYVDRFLAGGNDLFGIPLWEDFSRLELEHVTDWLIPFFKNASLEICVVGDFDRKRILELVGSHFGSLPVREGKTIVTPSIVFPKGQTLDLEIPSKINKAMIVMAWETEDFYDIERTRRLSMLAGLLEERIREVIREKLGVIYSPTVYNLPSRIIPGYGTMIVQLIVEPHNIERVKEAVLEICEKMERDGIDIEELEKVRLPVLTMLKDWVRNNRYWVNSVLALSSRYPDQLQWPLTIIEDNMSITADEMSSYAKKYLQQQDVAIAVVKTTAEKE